MIISHSRKFIFIKSRKTASTSIELFIAPNLAADDVWTPLSRPRRTGQNYYSLWPFDWLSAKSGRARRAIGKNSRLHWRYFHDHVGASRIQAMTPQTVFDSYFKFCFDRNPWDFMVSRFFDLKSKGSLASADFDTFLHSDRVTPNWDLYSINDIPVVDRVYRYEDLDDAIAALSTQFGFEQKSLPRAKAGSRLGRDYRSFYSASARDYVGQRWQKTIERLGYDF